MEILNRSEPLLTCANFDDNVLHIVYMLLLSFHCQIREVKDKLEVGYYYCTVQSLFHDLITKYSQLRTRGIIG